MGLSWVRGEKLKKPPHKPARAGITLRQARLFLVGIVDAARPHDTQSLWLTLSLLRRAVGQASGSEAQDAASERAADRLLAQIERLPPALAQEFLGWLQDLSLEGEDFLQLKQGERDDVDVGLLREVEEETEGPHQLVVGDDAVGPHVVERQDELDAG